MDNNLQNMEKRKKFNYIEFHFKTFLCMLGEDRK